MIELIEVLYIIQAKGKQIRLEEWPEGHVLWYGGKIVWASWGSVDRLRELDKL